ncbi:MULTISPECIES: NETI motif-containing protein [Staphylococcus]|uniref:NETI motif-containing protein n=1 Tax=Staphylococcus coagulans TaxID=74706 RepID=A0A9X1J6E0_9STAP|nr:MULTISPECIES: NETI motif-containing protein [Staphylococcus]NHA36837.1 NETI motif-containing protein [Staphylococcus schleiferi]MBA8760454.1 NETI motif-containing protein [Staphylococcus coagulans]MBA8762745.1 NETI motif-containing protein [Staphylococcus coagulans]MBA8764970.1 NETI motif-containing protein [Staphylococcus coagulans]MBA8769166.1 NETI motif-containing protein [Staphylococcus coagulans]
MKFKVEADETIQDCLARMRAAGYMPVKRFEKPVFKENANGEIEVLRQEIEFTGKKMS